MGTSFHTQLQYYSQAGNPQELVSRMANDSSLKSITSSGEITERVSIAMDRFLRNNSEQIAASDLPALNELAGLVRTLTTQKTVQEGEKDHLRALERTIKASIEIASNRRLLFRDYIKLFISGENISPFTLKEATQSMKEIDVRNFVNEVITKRNDRETFNKMVNTFFKYALPDAQQAFFSQCNRSRLHDIILQDIIPALPEDMTYLNLNQCYQLTDQNVEQITNRLTGLQTLSFRDCPLLTDQAIITIANSRNMANLQELEFGSALSTSLGDEAVSALAGSGNMANLRKLSLLFLREITAKAVAAISNSPLLANLQKLYLVECPLITDDAIRLIAQSKHLGQLQQLHLVGCRSLTNEAATAIAQSSTLTNLRSITIQRCPLVTDEAAKILHAGKNLYGGGATVHL